MRLFLVDECKCDIVLVFDGASHPNKELTQQARREASEAAKIKLMTFIEAQNYSEDTLMKIVKDIVRPNGAVTRT